MRLATQSTTQSFAQPLISRCDSRLRQSGQRDRDTQAHGRVQRVVKNVKVDATLQIALLALVPVCMLFAGSAALFFSAKTVASFLQLLSSGFLVIVVLTHLSEALDMFPWMNWGRPHSVGHYLDFWSAVLGFTLFPVGYLLHALTKRRS